MKKRVLLSALLLFCCTAQAVFATSWVYFFVVWNNGIYIVTDERVEEVGRKIGKVTSYSDMEQRGGNFSNRFPKGTAYYVIRGVATTEAIAVAHEGQYIKAIYDGEYSYVGSVKDKVKVAFGVVVIAIVAFLIYSIVPSFKKT